MCAQLHRHMWNARTHTHIEFCGRSYELRIKVLHTQFETLAQKYIENTHRDTHTYYWNGLELRLRDNDTITVFLCSLAVVQSISFSYL